MAKYYKIPDFVMLKKIHPNSKLLYGIILLYSRNKDNYCYASNEHFCELLQVKERSVSNYLKELKDNNLIEVKMTKSVYKGIIATERQIKIVNKSKKNKPEEEDFNNYPFEQLEL